MILFGNYYILGIGQNSSEFRVPSKSKEVRFPTQHSALMRGIGHWENKQSPVKIIT
ncbi:hypothetical protein [Nostoc sp.]|uniref:hypothetical protein n=1 Tax=Nostoc sp. TaxID=1180 RepID=UPI002FF83229